MNKLRLSLVFSCLLLSYFSGGSIGPLLMILILLFIIDAVVNKVVDDMLFSFAFFSYPIMNYLSNKINVSLLLMILLVGIILVFNSIYRNGVIFKDKRLALGFIFFFIVMIFQLNRSRYFDYGLYKVIYFTVYFIFFLGLSLSIRIDKLVISDYFMIFSMVQYLFLFENIGLPIRQVFGYLYNNPIGLRNIANFDPIYDPRYSAVLVLFGAYSLFNKRSSIIISLTSITIPFLVVIASQTRQSLYALIIIFGWMAYDILKNNKIYVKIISVIISLGLVYTINNIYEQNVDKYRVFSLESTERTIHYASAWNKFLENPILGLGLGGYGDFYWPHNIFLELLVEFGLIGMLFSILYLFWIIRKFYYIDSPFKYLLFMVFCLLLISAMFSADLARNSFLIFISLFVADRSLLYEKMPQKYIL